MSKVANALYANSQVHQPADIYANCSQMRKTRGAGRVTSTVSASDRTTPPHHHSGGAQWRWSADFCGGGASSSVIAVNKSETKPRPPQRGESVLRQPAPSHAASKRHSCPPTGLSIPLSRPSSTSSSTSTSSSSSSPPSIPTSVITGPSPLGWRMRPKSSNSSPRARTARLSLQIPLSVSIPDLKSNPAPKPDPASLPDPTSLPAPTPKTDPTSAPRPKPSRRRHSDSSAFLRSLAAPLPVVTLQELSAVQLRPVSPDEPGDVFTEGNEEEKQEEEKAALQSRKIPPPVAAKPAMPTWLIDLIAESLRHPALPQSPGPAEANQGEAIYTSLRKTKPQYSQQPADHSTQHATKTELQLGSGGDRERSTPRFPG
ncbi:WAS/WASL-interacting protein family member 3-like isoform X2 [Centroberyx affinis]|uniref:WAS/WASL-interacting protein family member 3-like isoform X2 n=1 Tax=Centroberyx affinis TaxID=166261 RepID=UPI003A5BFFB5